MKNIPENLDEIIFENRNKDYGAYMLRKNYNKNVLSAVIIAVIIFLLGVSLPLIANYLNKSELVIDDGLVNVVIENLPDKKPLEKLPEIPSEKKKEFSYRPPIVTTNEDEITDELSNLMDEVKNTNPLDTAKYTETTDEISKPIVIDDDETFKIHTVVEEMPEFPGGDNARIKYFLENIHYPVLAREMGIQGTVFITFVVEKSGEITSVKLIRGIGGGCDEEALRVISSMPKWKPGRQNGIEVRVQINMPIMFTLK